MNAKQNVTLSFAIVSLFFNLSAQAWDVRTCLAGIRKQTQKAAPPVESFSFSDTAIDAVTDGNDTYLLTADGVLKNKAVVPIKRGLWTKFLSISQSEAFVFVAMKDDGFAVIDKKTQGIVVIGEKNLDFTAPSSQHVFEARQVTPVSSNLVAVADGRRITFIDIFKRKIIFSKDMGLPPEGSAVGEYKGKKALFVADGMYGVQILDIAEPSKIGNGVRTLANIGKIQGLPSADSVGFLNANQIVVGRDGESPSGLVTLFNLNSGRPERELFRGSFAKVQTANNRVYVTDSIGIVHEF